MHEVGDEQDTPFNLPCSAPTGYGVAWKDHVEPFQRSASGASIGTLLPYAPTAVQAVGTLHETPAKKLPSPGGAGSAIA
jgi:hypothetical protein